MLNHTHHITKCLVILVLAGLLDSESRGDFVLWNDEQLTVNTSHNTGTLYDRSRARIVSGGVVSILTAYDFSTVDISGGSGVSNYANAYNSSTVNMSGGVVHNYLDAHNTSVVNLSGGRVSALSAWNSSNVNMSGGEVGSNHFYAYDGSTVNISGGKVGELAATATAAVNMSGGTAYYLGANNTSVMNLSGGQISYALGVRETSAVTFIARDFRLGSGLSLDGDRVLGTGMLSGEWFDGTPWAVNIATNDATATILAIPEPATLGLLALGGLGLTGVFKSSIRRMK